MIDDFRVEITSDGKGGCTAIVRWQDVRRPPDEALRLAVLTVKRWAEIGWQPSWLPADSDLEGLVEMIWRLKPECSDRNGGIG